MKHPLPEKIIYIVDEKKRDLLPMLSLARENKRLFKYQYIAQFNELIKLEKKIIKNSIIIVNFFRKNILHFLVYFYFLNAKIIINDTEGVGGKDGFLPIRTLNKLKNFLGIINQYWLWGHNQYYKIPKILLRKLHLRSMDFKIK